MHQLPAAQLSPRSLQQIVDGDPLWWGVRHRAGPAASRPDPPFNPNLSAPSRAQHAPTSSRMQEVKPLCKALCRGVQEAYTLCRKATNKRRTRRTGHPFLLQRMHARYMYSPVKDGRFPLWVARRSFGTMATGS